MGPDLPLLGTAVDGPDVYEIREGDGWPVTIWRDGRRIGYVTDEELRMACAGHVPQIRVGVDGTRRLAGQHFRLRQAVGEMVRDPKAGLKLDLAQVGGRR